MTNKILLTLVIAWLSCEIVSAVTDKVVCYHGTWSKYRNGNGQFTVPKIDPTLCRYLIYTFVGINPDGSINLLDEYLDVDLGNFATFNALREKNPKLKTLVAVGGWNEGSLKYSAVAANATARAIFIQSALNLVLTYGFNGFDLDWEYPGQRGGFPYDVENFSTLIKEFRAVFDKHGLLLTAAVAAASASVDLSYHVPALSQYLDLINVMAYDLHGAWDDVTGHNAPLYASSVDITPAERLLNVDAAIKGWIQRGADPQKLVLGIGTYGRTFTLANAKNPALGAGITGAGNAGPYTREAGMLGYNEICELQRGGGWTTVWNDEQKVPYAYKGNQWVGYDNVESITLKVEFAKSLNLAGVMIWSVETDDFNGICGNKYPLLKTINRVLGISNGPIPEDQTVTEGGPVTEVGPVTEGPISQHTTTTTAPVIKDENANQCTAAGYARDPKNCNVFYYCLQVGSSYVALVQQCSVGLVFDVKLQTCNWPAQVNCD